MQGLAPATEAMARRGQETELFEVSSVEMPWSPRVWGEVFLGGI